MEDSFYTAELINTLKRRCHQHILPPPYECPSLLQDFWNQLTWKHYYFFQKENKKNLHKFSDFVLVNQISFTLQKAVQSKTPWIMHIVSVHPPVMVSLPTILSFCKQCVIVLAHQWSECRIHYLCFFPTTGNLKPIFYNFLYLCEI